MQNDKVFLSYAREDVDAAKELYEKLHARGVDVWFDLVSLPPGAKWKQEIFTSIRESRYFLVLLSSNSVSKKGFIQAEIREGLDVLDQYPDNEIYIIPVRLDDCQPVHQKLQELNWVDIFTDRDNGIAKLIKFLAPPKLRCDGVYVSQGQISKGKTIVRYFRFNNDGSLTGGFGYDSDTILNKEQESEYLANHGDYVISDSKLSFSTDNTAGEVTYEGEIGSSEIILKFHSKINGNRGVFEFVFQED